MLLPSFKYYAPHTLDEAADLLKENSGAAILAGGTDILPAMKNNLKDECGSLVSLDKIMELQSIEDDEKTGLRIGAMVKLGSVREKAHTLEQEKSYLNALEEACASVGAWQHREMGTIGGNICLETRCIYYNQPVALRNALLPCFKTGGDRCHVQKNAVQCMAVFCGDVTPALLVLNATVDIFSKDGTKTEELQNIFTGDGKVPHTLQSSELLMAITVPPHSNRTGSTYLKYRTRGSIDFPLVGVAALVGVDESSVCNEARVAVTGIAGKPVLLTFAEEILKGKHMPDKESSSLIAKRAYDEMHPLNNTKGSPYHRRIMIRLLIEKALTLASERALNHLQREEE